MEEAPRDLHPGQAAIFSHLDCRRSLLPPWVSCSHLLAARRTLSNLSHVTSLFRSEPSSDLPAHLGQNPSPYRGRQGLTRPGPAAPQGLPWNPGETGAAKQGRRACCSCVHPPGDQTHEQFYMQATSNKPCRLQQESCTSSELN